MSAAADYQIDEQDGARTLRLSGDLSLARMGDLPDRIDRDVDRIDRIDMSGVSRVDTVGAWVVHRLASRNDTPIDGLSDDGQRLLAKVQGADQPIAKPVKHGSAFTRVLGEIGEAVSIAGRSTLGLIGFMGATTIALGNVIRHPSRFRFNATVHRFEVVGVSALGIIGLMSFLIGIVIAQQGAVQLRQFGAEVFTINLIGRLTLRELGLLMTAIMVAGRSGSAFAAQLGTMKLTEEIDAMRTIGVSPMEALVLPRFFAAVLLLPLLGFYASMISIIGGGLYCWAALGIPPITFIQRIQEVVPITDLYVGLIKAPVFGAIIAMSGCYQGMQVESDAEQVGLRTTSAVVQAIFLVIVLDAFFAVFFERIGWI
ncbi:ABC transporter permease [Sphingomonas aestuarii]